MPTSTVEDYLKRILIEEQREPETRVSTGKIAALLEVAPGTATAMIKTLAARSLVDYEPYSGVRLTESGRKLAAHVVRRHRIVELFLVQILGMDWSEVHADAEQLEHVISDRLLERMDEVLGHPSVDPHGDPIPSAEGEVPALDLPSLLSCALDETLEIARVFDQDAEFLRGVERRGLMPGTRVRVASRDKATDTVEIVLEGGDRLSLGHAAAAKILVRGVSSS